MKKRNFIGILIFLAIVSPVIIMALYSYKKTEKELTNYTLAQKSYLAHQTAITLNERFNRLTDIALSLSTRVNMRKLIAQGKWEEAVKILESIPSEFPFIERLFFSDLKGILRADTPPIPEVKGKDFSYRDWYQGVMKTGSIYFSEIYTRTAEPRYNVVAVAAPIQEKERLLGILVIQIKLDVFLEWTKDIEAGPQALVYFVDQNGKIAGHPEATSQGEIKEYSNPAIMQKIMKGEDGVEVVHNPRQNEDQLVAYEFVPKYGWGVIVEKPAKVAFATRSASLKRISIFYGLIFFISCLCAYLILRNNSKIKRAEEAIKISEERFRSVTQTAKEAIVLANSSGKIILWNQGAQSIFGYTENEALGQSLTLLMPVRYHDQHRQGFARFLQTGQSRVVGKTLELAGRRKDGSEFPLELSLSSWKTEKEIFFSGIMRDITERKQAEDKLHKLNESLKYYSTQLESANKELESFSYSVSHDLQAPLRSIDGFSLALLEDYGNKLDKEGKQNLERVRLGCKRMSQLIDDMLNLSRLTRVEMRPEKVNLTALAQEIVSELKNAEPDRKVEASISDNLFVHCDLRLIRAVLENLLNNAWKYTSKHPQAKIEIGSLNQNGKPVFYVKDDGAGFDMKYADKLFGAFQRLHRMDEFEGNGVGLATVKRVIHRHGGKVWAEAEPEKGATFYFTL